ncbi:NAD-dependent epimerase/dehydratase family protein [Synechococcus sp. PCC 7336]|uniref:NAD-dependent epimerase/dehydratase family protein n=1 Tax=Synechococcus sp. PCC 7336 TaxID=195250 RepID=UPI000571BC64|nr:NAD-dependent epimerase/dehydratase family protein [Synechococcus sp. PCC 7336]
MRILIMGGTRFVGVALTKALVAAGHDVVLFNRGNRPAPVEEIEQIHGDRKDPQQLKQKLQGQQFDAVFDNNGRELSDTQPLVECLRDSNLQHFVYMSSAGVYLKSNLMPHIEGDPLDPNSRHKGKGNTEAYLQEQFERTGFPYTSIRPVYIYGAGNYNDIEAFFYDRLHRDRPILVPDNGQWITQLGHVRDLAAAMTAVLGNNSAKGQIYNISDTRCITFNGLVEECAEAIGKSANIVHFDPKQFDLGKRKAFPLRSQHFFASIAKAQTELAWTPQISLAEGLKEFWHEDYIASGRQHREVDFAIDDRILAAI